MITSEEIKKQKDDFAKVFIPSNLDCFNAHKGFRPGEVHSFVGIRGGGKSTLAKTIIADALSAEKTVLPWLSEEMADKYLVPIYNMFSLGAQGCDENVNNALNRLKIVSELDLPPSYSESFWDSLKYDLDASGASILIYDNFTTGFMASMPYDKQYKAMLQLRQLAQDKNIPVIVFLHTDKKTRSNEKPMSSEDVKGLSTIVNLASYNYVLQPVIKVMNGVEHRVNFLIIDKARYHSEADKTIWEMKYNAKTGTFLKSEKVNRADYLDLFKTRKGKQ